MTRTKRANLAANDIGMADADIWDLEGKFRQTVAEGVSQLTRSTKNKCVRTRRKRSK